MTEVCRDKRARGVVLLATVAAIVGAHALYWGHGRHLVHDAYGYYELSKSVARCGLFGLHDEKALPAGLGVLVKIRTYGYPLFLAACSLLSTGDPAILQLVVFEVQLLLYLAVCSYGARVFQALTPRPGFGLALYLCTALNPWLLIRTTELITDLLAAALSYLALVLLLGSWLRGRRATDPAAARGATRQAGAAFFVAGCTAMLRPSGVVLVPALGLLWALGQWRAPRRLAAAPLLALACAVPFAPQLFNNYHVNGKVNPLLIHDLFKDNCILGMRYIKHGTMGSGGRTLLLLHRNPFLPADVALPDQFLHRRPVGYGLTCALHAFFLFDQDHPFTYFAPDRTWYRWPSSALSFAFLGLALGGVMLALRRVWRRRRLDRVGFAALAALAVFAAYMAIYLPSHVEARYGMPQYLLLSPFLVTALFRLGRLVRHGRYAHAAVLVAGLGLFVAGCCGLSAWLDRYVYVMTLG